MVVGGGDGFFDPRKEATALITANGGARGEQFSIDVHRDRNRCEKRKGRPVQRAESK